MWSGYEDTTGLQRRCLNEKGWGLEAHEHSASAIEAQKDLAMYVNRAVHEELNPLKVLDLFKRMSDEVRLLFFYIPLKTNQSVRTASSSVSGPSTTARKSTSGNTSPSRPYPSAPP